MVTAFAPFSAQVAMIVLVTPWIARIRRGRCLCEYVSTLRVTAVVCRLRLSFVITKLEPTLRVTAPIM